MTIKPVLHYRRAGGFTCTRIACGCGDFVAMMCDSILLHWCYSGLLKLSVEQKCDIAAREVEILREDMARKDKEYEQLLDSYKVCV